MIANRDLDEIVRVYLDQLNESLADLPAVRRMEVVTSIASHIEEARTGMDIEDEISLRELLDRVGMPEDIALSAWADMDIPPLVHRKSLRWVVAGVAACLVILAVVLTATLSSSGPPRRAPQATVPYVVGPEVNLAIAEGRITAAGLHPWLVCVPNYPGLTKVGAIVGEIPLGHTAVGGFVNLFLAGSPSGCHPSKYVAPKATNRG